MVSCENHIILKDKNTWKRWVLWKTSHKNNKNDGGPWGLTHGEGEGGLTPFILLPRTLLLTAPPLLAPRCAAKLSRLRRESSLRRPAPSSLVVPGGGREERRAGRRRTGQVRAPLFFKPFQITHLTIYSISLMQSKNKLLKKTISKRKEYHFDLLFLSWFWNKRSFFIFLKKPILAVRLSE